MGAGTADDAVFEYDGVQALMLKIQLGRIRPAACQLAQDSLNQRAVNPEPVQKGLGWGGLTQVVGSLDSAVFQELRHGHQRAGGRHAADKASPRHLVVSPASASSSCKTSNRIWVA